MNEQERRREILKAEEVIRLLAGELSKASEYADLADKARQGLVEAINALKQSTAALLQAEKSVSDLGERSSQIINSTSQETLRNLSEISKQLDVATDRLQAAALLIEDNPKLSRLISINRWLIILIAIAIGGVAFNILIMLFK